MMSQEAAKKFLPVIQAIANGESIKGKLFANTRYGRMGVVNIDLVHQTIEPPKWKIKYRPFRNEDECLEEMNRHEDFGWVMHYTEYLKIAVSGKRIFTINSFARLKRYSFQEAMDTMRFCDGKPFGMVEEWI